MVQFQLAYTEEDLQEILKVKPPKGMRSGTYMRPAFGWVIFLGAVLSGYAMTQVHSTPASPAPFAPGNPNSRQMLVDLLLPLLPWLCIFGFIWFFVYWNVRQRGKRAWRGNPALQDVQSFSVDEAGIRMTSAFGDHFSRWIAFNGWAESQNLFVLFMYSRGRVGIPKREMDAAGIAEVRRILEEKIHGGKCAACGYDLRASPERCPECGAIQGKLG